MRLFFDLLVVRYLPNLETAEIGEGLHYVQEDQPQAIGDAIAAWMRRHGLGSRG